MFCWILFFLASSYRFDANGNLETLKRYAWDGSQSKLMDDFVYEYNESINNGHNNRLSGLSDFAGQSQFSHVDIDESMTTDNYEYDEIGQLISDADEEIENISWTVTNKVKEIRYHTGKVIRFDYDAMGNRIAKHFRYEDKDISTYYILDAQGNQMAMYKHITEDPLGGGENNLYLSERNIYGSSRIGQEKIGEILASSNPNEVNINTATQNSIGDKFFEMSNHLGNVLEVVTDRKLPVPDDNGNIDYFLADVVSYSDYYPFGMQMPGRNGSTDEYRYGFQNQEVDNKIKGEGNSINYKYRMHDPRIGRFFAVDPLDHEYPHNGPYNFSENMVIHAVELEGLEASIAVIGVREDGTRAYPDDKTYIQEASNGTNFRPGEFSDYMDGFLYDMGLSSEDYGSNTMLTVFYDVDNDKLMGVHVMGETEVSGKDRSSDDNSPEERRSAFSVGGGGPVEYFFGAEAADDLRNWESENLERKAPLPVRILVKAMPGPGWVDAGYTIFTGKDMMSPEREEVTGVNRYILPIITIGTGVGGTVVRSSTILNAVDKVNTGVGVFQEIQQSTDENADEDESTGGGGGY